MYRTFRTFLENAKPKETYIYHEGYLANDREKAGEVKNTAELAMNSERMGVVELYQRRISYGMGTSVPPVFHYIARKR